MSVFPHSALIPWSQTYNPCHSNHLRHSPFPFQVGTARAQVQCGRTADELRNLTMIASGSTQVWTPGFSKASNKSRIRF